MNKINNFYTPRTPHTHNRDRYSNFRDTNIQNTPQTEKWQNKTNQNRIQCQNRVIPLQKLELLPTYFRI